MLSFLPPEQQRALLQHKGVPRLMIARNPYTRLLSAWLDKMRGRAGCVASPSRMHTHDCQQTLYDDVAKARPLFGNDGPIMADTFPAFLQQLKDLAGKLKTGLAFGEGVNPHFAQQTS